MAGSCDGRTADRPVLEKAIERALETGESYDLELRFVTATGTPLYVRTIGRAICDDGAVVKLTGSVQDITDRKRAQEQLEAVFAMSLAMICIADLRTGMLLRVNPAFTEVLGYSEDELLAQPFAELLHPDDVEPTRRVVEDRLARGERVIAFENRWRHKDGSYRRLSWNSPRNSWPPSRGWPSGDVVCAHGVSWPYYRDLYPYSWDRYRPGLQP